MRNTGTCPKCSSRDLDQRLPVLDRAGKDMQYALCLVLNAGATGWFTDDQQYLRLEASRCRACGYVELYAKDVADRREDLASG